MVPTEEARIAEISAKVAVSTETHSAPWQNTRESLPVINLSLDSVLLNPESHRIRAQIESHPESRAVADHPHSERAQAIIEKILSETSEFRALVDNLRENGQLDAGIVTHAGVLVNGNTRAVALREIDEEYIRVGVLPRGATEREITELEARLQLARDLRQDYTLTNELLFIKEQIDFGTDAKDLAILLGKAQSRSPQHLNRGVAKIEESLRILQHIREVQASSDGTIPLTFFDDHESALSEADRAYMALRDSDPAEARRVRDGRIAGVLVRVTYRNLRNWDSDQFLREYVEPQFDDDDVLTAAVGQAPGGYGGVDPDDDDGLRVLEGMGETEETAVDPTRLLTTVALLHGRGDDDPSGVEGLTKAQLYDGIQERITQAAEEREQDRRDERRQSTPIKLVREARQKVVRAREALSRSKRGATFDHGRLSYELRQLRKEVKVLSEANEDDA